MPETLTDAQKVLRNDTGKRIAVALEALASEVDPSTVIAPEYDATQTYAVGDLVMRRSVLYRCTTAITTAEAWTAAHWTAVTVADELGDKYVKPTGGIPKNDLAAGVQASLDKADTAIQLGLTGASVGDLVRVAAVDANGKPTSWNHVPLCDITTNLNLLDDWYFVGGGSQQGGGQFPINQRGQASYSSSGYTIDRWATESSAASVTLNADNVQFNSNAANNVQLKQLIENSKLVDGETYTMSVLVSGITSGGQFLMFLGGTSSPYPSLGTVNITFSGLVTSTFTFDRGSYTGSYKFVLASKGTAQQTLWIKAVKLELGSEQTLAHQENGAWVLNEIPDYGQELMKCQRFYETGILYIGTWPTANYFDTYMPFKVTKAKTPNCTGVLEYYGGSAWIPVTNPTISPSTGSPLFGVRVYGDTSAPAGAIYRAIVTADSAL